MLSKEISESLKIENEFDIYNDKVIIIDQMFSHGTVKLPCLVKLEKKNLLYTISILPLIYEFIVFENKDKKYVVIPVCHITFCHVILLIHQLYENAACIFFILTMCEMSSVTCCYYYV